MWGRRERAKPCSRRISRVADGGESALYRVRRSSRRRTRRSEACSVNAHYRRAPRKRLAARGQKDVMPSTAMSADTTPASIASTERVPLILDQVKISQNGAPQNPSAELDRRLLGGEPRLAGDLHGELPLVRLHVTVEEADVGPRGVAEVDGGEVAARRHQSSEVLHELEVVAHLRAVGEGSRRGREAPGRRSGGFASPDLPSPSGLNHYTSGLRSASPLRS